MIVAVQPESKVRSTTFEPENRLNIWLGTGVTLLEIAVEGYWNLSFGAGSL